MYRENVYLQVGGAPGTRGALKRSPERVGCRSADVRDESFPGELKGLLSFSLGTWKVSRECRTRSEPVPLPFLTC